MFFLYLKDRRGVFLLFALFTVIFTVVFALFALPLAAVGYGALLCMLAGACAVVLDYSRYRSLRRALIRLCGQAAHSAEALPAPRNRPEQDYQNLLAAYEQFLCGQAARYDTARTEMTDFYTMWVHQIKTPIAAMRLLLQGQAGLDNAPLLQELFKIERYAELVLGYLRIEDISSDLAPGECSLERIVTQAVKKYAPLFVYKKLGIQLENMDITVLTDEKWLVFVVEQLLSNALKYTRQGAIRLYTKPGPTLIIEDSGIGIRPEDLPRVFDRGFTGWNGRMDQKATGLGLYLCKKTLDKLHHGVSIASTPGEGTSVRIDLARGALPTE